VSPEPPVDPASAAAVLRQAHEVARRRRWSRSEALTALVETLSGCVQARAGTPEQLSTLFAALCRAAGCLTRCVRALDVIPLRCADQEKAIGQAEAAAAVASAAAAAARAAAARAAAGEQASEADAVGGNGLKGSGGRGRGRGRGRGKGGGGGRGQGGRGSKRAAAELSPSPPAEERADDAAAERATAVGGDQA
jgi:hypothetical protein